jgi:hypothetical protein
VFERLRVWSDARFSGRFSARALMTILALPFVIMIIGLPGRSYVPIGDEASILYRIQQVGTAHTPLVGVYSTRGWAHPGPILYYLLAVPYRLSGGQPLAAFAGAVLIALASFGLTGYLAYRRRQLAGFIVFAAAGATLVYGLISESLLQIWNPNVPLIPYLAFCFALWGVAERDFAVTPAAVLLGSAIVQMHVSYLPLVVVGALSVGGWLALTRRAGNPALTTLSRRGKWWTFGAAALLWLPPLIDLLFGDHNGVHVLRYFLHSHGETSGLSYGLGLLSGHVKLTGPWAGGAEHYAFENLSPAALASLLLLVILLVVLASLNVATSRPGAAMAVVALGQLAAGAVAAAKLQPPYLGYLIVWTYPLAAFCWAAVALSAFDLASGRTARVVRWIRSPAVALVLLVVAVVQTARTCQQAFRPPLPRQSQGQLVSTLLPEVKARIPAQSLIRVEGAGDSFNDAWVGILYGLAERHQPFLTSDGAAGQKWGPTHRWSGQSVAQTVTIASDESDLRQGAVVACERDSGETPIATWQLLSPAERQEYAGLLLLNVERKGRIGQSQKTQLERLSARAQRVVVFTGDHVCGN